MGEVKPKALDMEIAVAYLIGPRKHVIVPNVSWGMGFRHECDLLCLDPEGRFTEIEIKVSKADLIKDFDKKHQHSSDIISRLVYAVPDFLLDTAQQLVPKQCGIISVKRMTRWVGYPAQRQSDYWRAEWVRIPRHGDGKKPTEADIKQFLRLGCMRIWTLKNNIRKA